VIADHTRLKELKITDIKVGQRHRRDMGDLTIPSSHSENDRRRTVASAARPCHAWRCLVRQSQELPLGSS
jgi:hypothetical protein